MTLVFTIEKLQSGQPLYGVWCCGAVFVSHRHAEEHECRKVRP